MFSTDITTDKSTSLPEGLSLKTLCVSLSLKSSSLSTPLAKALSPVTFSLAAAVASDSSTIKITDNAKQYLNFMVLP